MSNPNWIQRQRSAAARTSDPGWLLRQAPAPIEATSRFTELYAHAVNGVLVLPPGLLVWLAPGIFTQLYPGYFMHIKQHLARRRVALRTLPGSTVAPLYEAANGIREAVLAGPEGAILLGHSKGPLDLHAALVVHPKVADHVRGFISLQAPFGGTPLATDAQASRLLRKLAPRSYFEMGYDQRRAFLLEHSPLSPVPTVSLATSASRAGWPLEQTRKHLAETHGLASDGFVPLQDAQLPGAQVVKLEGLDHASLALRWMRPNAPFHAGAVIEALLALCLETSLGDAPADSP